MNGPEILTLRQFLSVGGAFLRIVTDSWTGYFSKGASSSGYTQKLQVVVLEPCKCKIKKKYFL